MEGGTINRSLIMKDLVSYIRGLRFYPESRDKNNNNICQMEPLNF